MLLLSILLVFLFFLENLELLILLLGSTGYKMDEDDPDSKFLRLQFARNPGPRSGPGIRGRR